MDFKNFLLTEGYEQDLKKTLAKIPKKHKALIRGYKFKFQPGNELKGEHDSIGLINRNTKVVTVAAPWNYGREYTVLHEIAHLIWETLNEKQQTRWREIVKKHPSEDKPRQSNEEYFAMAYASAYAHNQIKKFCIPAWHKFIQGL